MPESEWKAGRFTTDGERWYSGYTRGDKWNGFDCPFFERAVADQIAADFSADPYEKEGGGKAWYDPAKDAFFFRGRDDVDDDGTPWDPEPMGAVEARIGRKKLRLYCIGGWEWTWSAGSGRGA